MISTLKNITLFFALILLLACNNHQETKTVIPKRGCELCNDLESALKVPIDVQSISIKYYKHTIDTLMQFENLDCLMFQKVHVNSSQLFKDLSKLKNLKSIYFFENASFNIIPEEIIGLKNIEVLEVEDTITKISDNFYKLKTLKNISIFSNDVSSKLVLLSNLEQIKIGSPNSNLLPFYIARLENVSRIDLFENTLFIPDLSKMKKLTVLQIGGSRLNDELTKLKSTKERQLFYENLSKRLTKNCMINNN